MVNDVVEEETHNVSQTSQTTNIPQPTKQPQRYEVSKEEYNLLLDLVFCEGNTESIECQMSILQVVFNRVESDMFPNTIHDVVFQDNPTQFTPTVDGSLQRAKPNDKNKEALDAVLKGDCELPSNILYFWASWVDTTTPGTWFYKMHQQNFYITIDHTNFYSGWL